MDNQQPWMFAIKNGIARVNNDRCGDDPAISSIATPDFDLYPTILDAQGNGRVVYISTNSMVNLSHLSIINGVGDGGGGIRTFGPLTITNVVIISNTTATYGAGIWTDRYECGI